MFEVGETPSGGEFWFALSREPGTSAPAWALPCSGSLPSAPLPKLLAWAFQAVSVKPSLYDQSCMRLCIENRFASAASMSLRCADVNVVAGLHRCSNHWFV